MYMNKNMERPYDTEWGYYDPKTDEFVKKSNRVLRTLGEPQQGTVVKGITITNPSTATKSSTELKDKAKKAGLLGNKVREALWARLTPEQQSTIANKKGPKQKQWMDVLETAFDPATNTFDEAKLKGTVDEFLGRKGMYRKTDGSQRVWNKQKETKWLASVLPNLSTDEHFQIVNGLIRVAESSTPDYAYGQFKRGVMIINDQAARGTVYHEAFHAVTHTLLTPQEYKDMFDAAKQKWGDISRLALEENLAEDFRRYVQLEETPVIGSLVKIYRTLKHLVQNLFGKEPYLNKMFYNINRGKFANRIVENTNVTRNRATDVFEIQKQINKLKSDYNKANTYRNSARSTDRSVIDNIIKDSGLSDVLFSYQQNGNRMWSISRISKADFNKKIQDLQDKLVRTYESELSEDEKLSRQMLEEQESYYRRVEQYHRDQMLFENLSQEDKDYLQERGITQKEFSQMTQLEKEVLFHCKY